MPVTLTWTGHATWLIDTGHGVLLVDPFFDECPTAAMKAKDVRCDAILITHAHFDHVADAVSIAKRTHATVFCTFEIAQWLGRQGVEKTQPTNLGGRVAVPGPRDPKPEFVESMRILTRIWQGAGDHMPSQKVTPPRTGPVPGSVGEVWLEAQRRSSADRATWGGMSAASGRRADAARADWEPS